jgi:hypothetical protein
MVREGKKLQDAGTVAVRDHVRNWIGTHRMKNAKVDVYRLHPYCSIRLRIVDRAFSGKTLEERDALTATLLEGLPDEIDRDISLVLLLAPDELKSDFVNRDFEHPLPTAF